MTRAGITVVGSINIDYVLQVPRLPGAGETLAGNDFAVTFGGKGANQAVAAARLGADTTLIGCVGDDGGGRELLAALAEDGIETRTIRTVERTATGSALIFVAADGANCIGIAAGANGALQAADVDTHAARIRGADWLLLQCEVAHDVLQHAAGIARQAGVRVLLDPAPCDGGLPAALLERVDVLTPNETEAARLTGIDVATDDGIVAASEALRRRGPATVVITRGARGALINADGGIRALRPPAVAAIDSVAAGDTFSGALAVALAERRDIDDAVRFANAAAAIAVTRRGAQASIPYRAEVRIGGE